MGAHLERKARTEGVANHRAPTPTERGKRLGTHCGILHRMNEQDALEQNERVKGIP